MTTGRINQVATVLRTASSSAAVGDAHALCTCIAKQTPYQKQHASRSTPSLHECAASMRRQVLLSGDDLTFRIASTCRVCAPMPCGVVAHALQYTRSLSFGLCAVCFSWLATNLTQVRTTAADAKCCCC